MMTVTPPTSSASSSDGHSISAEGLRAFRQAVADRRDVPAGDFPWVLKSTSNRTACISSLAEFTIRYPSAEGEAIEFVSKLLGIQPAELRRDVETEATTSVVKQRYSDAYASLTPKPVVDYTIDDLLPSSVANIIRKSCDQSGADYLSSVFMMLAVTGTLLGSKYMVHSGKNGTDPLAANLYLFICGDSSSWKSLASKKFIRALKRLQKLGECFAEKQKKIAMEMTDENDKRAELKRIATNSSDYISDSLSFSAEAFLKELSQQPARTCLHLHQDEGSDLFGCERYSNGSGMGLFQKTLIEIYGDPAAGRVSRTNSDNAVRFSDQTITLTANLQKRFVTDVIDFAEDSQGWTARTILIEALSIKDESEEDNDGLDADPITSFLLSRLIPWCSDLTSRPIKKFDAYGHEIDYEVIRLDKFDGAQAEYNDFVKTSMDYALCLQNEGREAAYRSFLRKVGIRVAKFALLLHTLETQVGKQFGNARSDLGLPIPSGDPRHDLLSTPISLVTIKRAIKLEEVARAQFLNIADICRSAPSIREEEMKRENELATLQFVLDKVRTLGSVKEGDFKKKYKGSKGLSREDISGVLEVLAAAGCIARNKPKGQRTYHLTYIREMR